MSSVVRTATMNIVNKKQREYKWAGLLNTDTGDWLEIGNHSDKCFQVTGTFGGATVTIQGSNDPLVITTPLSAAAATLTDPLGNNATSAASTTMKQILENPRYIRPSVSGGDGTTVLSVILEAKKEY